MPLERNYGLELILHKFTNLYLLPPEGYEEIFTDLKNVGIVFTQINAFSTTAFIFTEQDELGSLLKDIEFVIIKSVANHILLKYEVEPILKYPDPEVQKYYSELQPLTIDDLLVRCNSLLKKCRQLVKNPKPT
jgi:hypothetical protein